jgi:ferrochelatase
MREDCSYFCETGIRVKLAVVLFNLGGPDSPEAVEPFLRNLFGDPAIISLPFVFRKPLAWLIARRRAPIAREIYAKIGGRSPILEETEAQAWALESALAANGHEVRAFIAMRCWKPFSEETVVAVKDWGADHVVLLPLYPQFSSTTTRSSLMEWDRAARKARLQIPYSRICCYPSQKGFVEAEVKLIRTAWSAKKLGVNYRLLLSAHGLPKRTISKGDSYQWQVEKTAAAIVDGLGIESLDVQICYQSRVGPLEWIAPATDAEIRRAGRSGKGLIVAPIAFVSEHSETLVELDIEYSRLAVESGVVDYIRVPTVGTQPPFIEGLAQLVLEAAQSVGTVNGCGARICPREFTKCIHP